MRFYDAGVVALHASRLARERWPAENQIGARPQRREAEGPERALCRCSSVMHSVIPGGARPRYYCRA